MKHAVPTPVDVVPDRPRARNNISKTLLSSSVSLETGEVHKHLVWAWKCPICGKAGHDQLTRDSKPSHLEKRLIRKGKTPPWYGPYRLTKGSTRKHAKDALHRHMNEYHTAVLVGGRSR